MGRLSTISDDAIFAAVASRLAEEGALSLQKILDETGISVGSLYHRYGSREGLLAQVWLDAVTEFQSQFLEALTSGLPDAGETAALVTPRFCRKEYARALILTCCRPSEFLNDKTPADLQTQMKSINDPIQAALKVFAKSEGVKLETAKMALIGFPLGAVKLYLPHKKVPKSVDRHVVLAYRSVMHEKRDDL